MTTKNRAIKLWISQLTICAQFSANVFVHHTLRNNGKKPYGTVHFDSTFSIRYFMTRWWGGTRQLMKSEQLCQVTSILSIFMWSMDLSFKGELFERRGRSASLTESFVKWFNWFLAGFQVRPRITQSLAESVTKNMLLVAFPVVSFASQVSLLSHILECCRVLRNRLFRSILPYLMAPDQNHVSSIAVKVTVAVHCCSLDALFI